MPLIQSMSIDRSPAKLEFVSSYEGPAAGQFVHTLRRQDVPAGLTTIAEIEDWVNATWLPSQLRDVHGQLMGYAAVHVYSISGQDIVWVWRVSTMPITGQWWPTAPPA